MNDEDFTPLKKLERKSIVTSNEFDSDDEAEAQFTYLLDNLLSDNDVHKILETKRKSSSGQSSVDGRCLENVIEHQFVQKYSSFSLMPDSNEERLMDSDISRTGTFENIISEEKFRKSSDGFKMITFNQTVADSNQVAVFKRIKKKLDDMRRYCPTLYNAENDVITIWGNMNLNIDNLNKSI